MHKVLLKLLIVVWVCGLAPRWSHADEVADKAAAQKHYNTGLRAYNLGEFDRAIKEWKSAYQFLGAPDFLFNIAQAYRQKHDYEDAIFFYNAYLRGKPDAANVGEVTALRDEMSVLLETQKKNDEMAPEPQELLGPNGEREEVPPASNSALSATSSAMISQPSEARSSSTGGRGLRITGMVAGGSGAIFVATGIAFMLSASSKESDLEAAATNQEVWGKKYADMEDSAERSATIGTVLLVTGVVAVIGGGVSYYFGQKEGEEAMRIEPTISLRHQETQAGLAVGWSF